MLTSQRFPCISIISIISLFLVIIFKTWNNLNSSMVIIYNAQYLLQHSTLYNGCNHLSSYSITVPGTPVNGRSSPVMSTPIANGTSNKPHGYEDGHNSLCSTPQDARIVPAQVLISGLSLGPHAQHSCQHGVVISNKMSMMQAWCNW